MQEIEQPFSDIDPDDLVKIDNASHLMSVLPNVMGELNAMMRTVQVRVFASIRDGKFTPEIAEAAWREMYTTHRLKLRLKSTVRVGQHVGENIGPKLTIGATHDS